MNRAERRRQQKRDKKASKDMKSIGPTPEQARMIKVAVALHQSGQLDEAEIQYKTLVNYLPDNTLLLTNLGTIALQKGKLEDGVRIIGKSLKIDPNQPHALNSSGNALKTLKRLDDALTSYDHAIALNPNYAEAYSNRGIALRDLKRPNEALVSYDRAIALKPENFEAHSNRGITLKDLKRPNEALASYDRAIALKPDYVEAHSNRGITLKDLNRLDEALASYDRAIALNPNYAEAYSNRGFALMNLNRLDEALASYNRAIALNPDYAEAYWNKSLLKLLMGEYLEGWKLYEWRWKINSLQSPPLQTGKPAWKPSVGQKVLLWSEQGIGDEIMFSSIIPEIYAKSKKLILQIDERLIPLFKRSFPKDIIYYTKRDRVPEDLYDSHLPIGSLPMFFRTELETFKNSSKGWLSACNLETRNLRSKLICGDTKTLIGISWHTIAKIEGRQIRTIPLNKLSSQLHSHGKELVSLQYGNVDEEVNNLFTVYGIKVSQVPEIDNMNDIDGLANLINACDKVVSIDNMTIHLAGALGKKSKLLLPYVCNWRWGQSRQTSYWYNSVQIFRQIKNGDWGVPLRHLGNVCNL